MLKSCSISMWIIGCLSLFAFAGLSGGLRLKNVEIDEDTMRSESRESRNFMDADAGLYLELEPVRTLFLIMSIILRRLLFDFSRS